MIAVVGDGVPSGVIAPRDHPVNNAQGRAMWDGAQAAFCKSPSCELLRTYAELVPRDDRGSVQIAGQIAEVLRADPRTIGVIGHATSGTTRAAAWLYAEAHVPLLMPIATSPYAIFPPARNREFDAGAIGGLSTASVSVWDQGRGTPLRNCFRLPPNDEKFQVAAVKYLITERLQSKRVYLLRDVSEDSGEYSGPLFSGLERLLGPLVVCKRRIDRESTNLFLVAESIRGYKADTVVLAGYGTTAQEMFHALRGVFPPDRRFAGGPRVVLTDGCKTEEVDPTGFEAYVTFPLPEVPLALPATASEDLKILHQVIENKKKQSYEIYGYDAALLLGRAFSRCQSAASIRGCLSDQLRKADDLSGVLFSYGFDANGENEQAPYYVYSSLSSGKITDTFRFSLIIPPEQMRQALHVAETH